MSLKPPGSCVFCHLSPSHLIWISPFWGGKPPPLPPTSLENVVIWFCFTDYRLIQQKQTNYIKSTMSPKTPVADVPSPEGLEDEVEPVITEENQINQKRHPMVIVWRNVVLFLFLHFGALYAIFLIPHAHPLTWLWGKFMCSLCVCICVCVCVCRLDVPCWLTHAQMYSQLHHITCSALLPYYSAMSIIEFEGNAIY